MTKKSELSLLNAAVFLRAFVISMEAFVNRPPMIAVAIRNVRKENWNQERLGFLTTVAAVDVLVTFHTHFQVVGYTSGADVTRLFRH